MLDKIFIMIDNKSMKSLLSMAILILNAVVPNSALVLASKCPLYTSPDFQSAIVCYNESDYYLTQNQEVEILSSEGDFILVKTEEDIEGYVYKYYITQNKSQEVYPVFNCSVRDNTLIYDLEKNSTTYVAKKGQRVFIFNGFDKIDGGFTEVQIVLDDGSLYSGLVKSSDLKPDGVNRNVIIAIPIILAGITVVLSIVLISKKKKKPKKNGSKN